MAQIAHCHRWRCCSSPRCWRTSISARSAWRVRSRPWARARSTSTGRASTTASGWTRKWPAHGAERQSTEAAPRSLRGGVGAETGPLRLPRTRAYYCRKGLCDGFLDGAESTAAEAAAIDGRITRASTGRLSVPDPLQSWSANRIPTDHSARLANDGGMTVHCQSMHRPLAGQRNNNNIHEGLETVITKSGAN